MTRGKVCKIAAALLLLGGCLGVTTWRFRDSARRTSFGSLPLRNRPMWDNPPPLSLAAKHWIENCDEGNAIILPADKHMDAFKILQVGTCVTLDKSQVDKLVPSLSGDASRYTLLRGIGRYDCRGGLCIRRYDKYCHIAHVMTGIKFDDGDYYLCPVVVKNMTDCPEVVLTPVVIAD